MKHWVVMVLLLSLAALPCHAGLSTDFMPVEEDLVKKEEPKQEELKLPEEQAVQPEKEKKTNWLLWGLAGVLVVGGVAALAGGGGGGGGGGSSGGGTDTGSVTVGW